MCIRDRQFTWRQRTSSNIIRQQCPINRKMWWFTRARNTCKRGWWRGWCCSNFNRLPGRSCNFWTASAKLHLRCRNGLSCAKWWQESGNCIPKQLCKGDAKELREWEQKGSFQTEQVGFSLLIMRAGLKVGRISLLVKLADLPAVSAFWRTSPLPSPCPSCHTFRQSLKQAHPHLHPHWLHWCPQSLSWTLGWQLQGCQIVSLLLFLDVWEEEEVARGEVWWIK